MATALYRRYRPDSFDQMIGQDHVTDPLRSALKADRVTHAYLFSGPRGCGKTTSARILARCLNCAAGPTDTPCGTCESCVELATGGPGSLDVVEIDAASHRGVDDARDLRERATFAPVRDRFKVFIIDEAHMVTKEGSNAMLKLVEEPPEHVKFIFATTEPEKVIGTIRSRTHHYPFRLVPPDVLEPYLGTLCLEESIKTENGVLPLVVRSGGGSVRDTLSVLDQLMAGAVNGELSYQRSIALLGYTDTALLDQTVDALAGGDGAAVFRVVEKTVESGHDPRRFVEDLLERLRDLLIIAVSGDAAAAVLSALPSDQFERMQVQAENWGPYHISRAADLTDEALRTMVGATSPRLQLELLLGRILVPQTGSATVNNQGSTLSSLPDEVGTQAGGASYYREIGNNKELQDGKSIQSSRADQLSAHSEEQEPGQSGRFGASQAREALRQHRSGTSQGQGPSKLQDVPLGDRAGRTKDFSSESGSQESARQPVMRAQGASLRSAQIVEPAADGAHSSKHGESDTPEQTVDPAQVSAHELADQIRLRWEEIVTHLSDISRATWALVHHSAQLGGVDSQNVILLFTTEGLVSTFSTGTRSADVERAIRDVCGVNVKVRSELAQSVGGASLTTPVNNTISSDNSDAAASMDTDKPSDKSLPVKDGFDDGWGPVAVPGGGTETDAVTSASIATAESLAGKTEERSGEESQGPVNNERSSRDEHDGSSQGHVQYGAKNSPRLSVVQESDGHIADIQNVGNGVLADGNTNSDSPVVVPAVDGVPVDHANGTHDTVDLSSKPSFPEAFQSQKRSDGPILRKEQKAAASLIHSQSAENGDLVSQPGIQETPISPQEDFSASMEDQNLDDVLTVGLPAVLDILGGTVIEEIADEQQGGRR